jgi:hypothetical protein
MKICREIPNMTKIEQKYRVLHMKTYVCFMLLAATYVAQNFRYLLNCWQRPYFIKNKSECLLGFHSHNSYANMP